MAKSRAILGLADTFLHSNPVGGVAAPAALLDIRLLSIRRLLPTHDGAFRLGPYDAPGKQISHVARLILAAARHKAALGAKDALRRHSVRSLLSEPPKTLAIPRDVVGAPLSVEAAQRVTANSACQRTG